MELWIFMIAIIAVLFIAFIYMLPVINEKFLHIDWLGYDKEKNDE